MSVTVEQLKKAFVYVAETGDLYWRNRAGGIPAGSIAGGLDKHGYRRVKFAGKTYFVHRLVWYMTHGRWPSLHIDHVNGNRLDNRIENLRDVDSSVNLQNQRRAHRNNTSNALGVSWVAKENKWRARIWANNKSHYLGRFASPNEAHEAYLEAKKMLHKGAAICEPKT